MKKIIISIIVFTTFTFCLTNSFTAQNWVDVRYADALEHLKMMEIFVGTWEWKVNEDTTWVIEFRPFEKGYELKVMWKADDKTYAEGRGIIGSAGPRGDRHLAQYFLWPNGHASRDVMKFLTEKKLVGRRYNLMHTEVRVTFELEMQTSDSYTAVWVERLGSNVEAWQRKPRVVRQTWNRVK